MNNHKLFAVYLGGRAPGCNIELHDVVFVAGESIKETFPQLQRKWFGSLARLHIDAYMELTYVDGFAIKLQKEVPAPQQGKLYFVNYGAYQSNAFTETHEMVFYIAANENAVKQRARQTLCLGLEQRHLDDKLLITDNENGIDDIIEISNIDGYYIYLEKSEQITMPAPIPGYIKIKTIEEINA